MFAILFHEREGSSALVKLLDNVPGLDMIFHKDGGIEPFDQHACDMNARQLDMMFENLFQKKDFYYSGSKLRSFGKFFGFKVRQNIVTRCDFVNIVNKYNIPVVILYRISKFDWALSRYHGDGRGGTALGRGIRWPRPAGEPTGRTRVRHAESVPGAGKGRG